RAGCNSRPAVARAPARGARDPAGTMPDGGPGASQASPGPTVTVRMGEGGKGHLMDDARAMRRALDLAGRGRFTVSPNPMVGCVIVAGGRIVGEGWHERAGGAHAEIVALAAAGEAARGATVYVTLEP